jgi:hypothetical protein
MARAPRRACITVSSLSLCGCAWTEALVQGLDLSEIPDAPWSVA